MSDEAPSSALVIKLPQLDQIKAMLEDVLEGRCRQEFYTLEQAWRRKYAAVVEEGCISLHTFKNSRALQPRGGRQDTWISNRKVWTEATIEEWLTVDDDGLAGYLERCESSAPIPERIKLAVTNRIRSDRRIA